MQHLSLRPYNVGGVYVQHRNAASVRRNGGLGWRGLGDSVTGICDATDPTCQMTGPTFSTAQLGTIVSANTGGIDIGTITVGVLVLYMVTAFVVTK